MDGFRLDLLPTDGSLGSEHTYRKDTVLWSRDQPAGTVYVVKRGEIEIIVPGHRGHETVIRIVKPGEICGLFCLCADRKDSAHTTGRTTMRTDVLEIQRADFENFLKGKTVVALALLVTACERLAYAEERIRVLAQRGAEDRILALLLQLVQRSGRPSAEHPELVRVQYTHSELARLSGMNRTHVSVVLHRLREKDIVRYGRGTPTHINMPALLRFVESQNPEMPG